MSPGELEVLIDKMLSLHERGTVLDHEKRALERRLVDAESRNRVNLDAIVRNKTDLVIFRKHLGILKAALKADSPPDLDKLVDNMINECEEVPF